MNDVVPGADASPEPEVEVVETDVKAVEAEVVEESEAESPPAVEENDEEKTNPFKERIDKLTENFRRTERQLSDMEQENVQLRQQLESIPAPQEQVLTLADFDYDETKYRQYVVEDTRRIARAEAEGVAKRFQGEAGANQVQSEYDARADAFAQDVPDFQQRVQDPNLRISPPMADVIRSTDVGPELAYFLASHPDESARLSRLTPVEVGMELSSMIGNIRTEKAKAKDKVSKAPPPPGKIRGADAALRVSTTDPKSDKLSDAEWFKAEELRQAKLRK